MAKPLINISQKQAYTFAAFLVLYEFLAYIANDMIMPGMIEVVKTFNGPESAVANSLTAYVLGGASLQLILGPLSDRYGRRPVMMFGVALFFLCTILIASSQSMDQFLTARFLQGMGLCFIGVVGYATLQEIFSETDAIRLIAIMANVSILAPLVGPLFGAVVIHYYSWRLIFIVIAAFSVIALLGLWRFMPESVGQIKSDGEEVKVTSISIPNIIKNYKALITNRTFILGSFAEGILIVPCLVWIALAPIILIVNAKLSVIQYGLYQIPIFGAAILGNLALQKLTNHFSSKQILWGGSLSTVLSLLTIVLFQIVLGANYLWIIPGLILYFFCIGITNAPLTRLVLFSTPVTKGTASAMMTLIAMLIQAIGIEGGNYFYHSGNNIIFGGFCFVVALLYSMVLLGAFYKH